MLPNITIDGRLVADPELRFTGAGKAVCSFRVAASDSKKDANDQWQTTEQIFIGVSLWEAEGEAAAEMLSKGDQVLDLWAHLRTRVREVGRHQGQVARGQVSHGREEGQRTEG